jgi:SAM-dependent methyltransferase
MMMVPDAGRMTTTTSSARTAIDQDALEAFMGRFVGDLGAAAGAANVVVGDRLGLYGALRETGPADAAQVAEHAGCDERHVHEWLCGQAAGGYVAYDPQTGRFSLTPEQAACLADPDSPTFLPGAFQLVASLHKDEDKLVEAIRTGAGLGWHEHHHDLFHGTERFFRPGYAAHLVEAWIPALDGVEAKLLSGALVADVGCGHGASTIILAQAFPRARVTGFDYHEASILAAREAAAAAGVGDRVRFEVAPAAAFPGEEYDLVCMFDCLHDMGDPVGAAAHVRTALADDGTWLIVEPYAGDSIEENLNPVGRIFYAASTLVCTPASRAQEVGLALGAQAGEARLREVVMSGGFSRFRRATETPFNLVLEARR